MNEQCKKCANCYERALKEKWQFGCSAGYNHINPDGKCVLFEEIKNKPKKEKAKKDESD